VEDRFIKAIAVNVWDNLSFGDTWEDVARINKYPGWTVEFNLDNKLRGNFVRYEGISLDDDDMARVRALVDRWIEDPNRMLYE
jgi:hypothetical protein